MRFCSILLLEVDIITNFQQCEIIFETFICILYIKMKEQSCKVRSASLKLTTDPIHAANQATKDRGSIYRREEDPQT